MNELDNYTIKQKAFCVHYTTIGSETFGNATKSAIEAGYSEKGAYARGSELLRNRKITDLISQLHTENMQRNHITVDKVLADLEHDKIMARKHNQYGVSKACTELQGKYLAMFSDRQIIEQPDAQVDQTKREQAKKLSLILLNPELFANNNAG